MLVVSNCGTTTRRRQEPLTRDRKNREKRKLCESEAQDIHCAVTEFLTEGLTSRLLNLVTNPKHNKILRKLIWRDGPVLAKVLVADLDIKAGAVWYATGKLNEHLDSFSQHNETLRREGITIEIPRGSKGGHKFGYYLACVDTDGQYVTAEEIRTRLPAAPRRLEECSGAAAQQMSKLPPQQESKEAVSHGAVSPAGEAIPGTDVSALKEEVLQYLHDLAEECARLPYFFPDHLKNDGPEMSAFDRIRQIARVVEDRSILQKRCKEAHEPWSPGRVDQGKCIYNPITGLPEHEDDDDGHGVSAETIAWDEQASGRFGQVVILGDPGFGKSWLLRYEARQLAHRAIDHLNGDRGDDVHHVDLPIWIHLPNVSPEGGTFEDTIVTIAGRKRSSRFHDYVRRQLVSDRAIVLLDAWDEVRPLPLRQKIQELVESFARAHPRSRAMLTSRIVGYSETLPPLPVAKELKLLAFGQNQIESFVEVWFGPDKSAPFLTRLRQRPQVHGLARIPLMLAMLCRACPDGDFPNSRSDLYERCLKGLLFEWKRDDRKSYRGDLVMNAPNPESMVKALLDLLGRIALYMTEHELEQVEGDDLDEFVQTFQQEPHKPISNLVGISPAAIVGQLKKDGVFVVRRGHHTRPFRFLHRTFREYCAARALSREPDYIDKALTSVYESAWDQVLVTLGGILKNPGPYIAALLRENREDLLCRPFFLAIGASVEAGHRHLPKEYFVGLTDALANILQYRRAYFLQESAHRALVKIPNVTERLLFLVRSESRAPRSLMKVLSAIGSQEVVHGLLQVVYDHDGHVHFGALEALAEIDSDHAVQTLIDLLRSKDVVLRGAAVIALKYRQLKQAAPALIELLADSDSNGDMRRLVVNRLGQTHSKEASPALIRALRDEYRLVRPMAAMALGGIRDKQAVPALIDAVRSEDVWMHEVAICALGNIGSDDAIPVLTEAVKYGYRDERIEAIEALGRIGSKPAIAVLLRLLQDEDQVLSQQANHTLSNVDSELVEPALLDLLDDKNKGVRDNAISVLGSVGSERAVQALIRLLKIEGRDLRLSAVWALGEIGDKQAIPHLVGMLRTDDVDMCKTVIRALEGITSSEAIPSLVEATKHRNKEIRGAAIEVLGRMHAEQADQALVGSLHDSDDHIRCLAVEALGKIASERALRALIKSLQDEDEGVRMTAAGALGRIGAKQAIPALLDACQDMSKRVRREAAWAVGKVGSEETVPELLQMLEWGNPIERDTSASILLGIQPNRAIAVPWQAAENQGGPCGLDPLIIIQRELTSLTATLDYLASLCENA